jgi:preprotein translocase subunit YajC
MSGSGLILIYIILFIGVFYFLAVRPQRRQRRAHQEMLSMIKKGDEVVTIGGIFGVVKELREDYVVLEIAHRTKVRFLKRAISSIVSEEEEEEEYEEEEPEEIEGETETDEDEEAEDDSEADDGKDEAGAVDSEDDQKASQ